MIKKLKENLKYIFSSFFIILSFYTIKFLINIYTSFPFNFDSFYKIFLYSFSLHLNIIITTFLFFKLLLKSKSIKKSNLILKKLLAVSFFTILLNDLGMFFMVDYLSLSLIISNILMFFIIFIINKVYKKKVFKSLR